jgi:potassium efflux system protein
VLEPSPMKTWTRRLPVAFLALLVLGVGAAGAASADVSPSDPAAADESLAAEFGRGAEDVTARLKDLERSLADAGALAALETEVSSYAHRTARHWHETSRQLTRNLRTTALDSLTTYWRALHSDLEDVELRINARVKRRDAELASVTALHDSWAHALEMARDAHEPVAVLQRVQSTIDAIDQTRPAIEQRRARLLVMQNGVSRAFQHCADALARIADARSEALARLLQPQDPPLWRVVTDPAVTAWSGAAFEADLANKGDGVRMYVESYRGRLALSALLMLLTVLALRWASHRLAALGVGGGDATPSHAFRTPVASGVLVGLLLTIPLRPTPPYELQQATLVLLLAASVCVFRPVVAPRLRSGLYGACVLFAIELVMQLLEPAPRLEQLLLVLLMGATSALLVWVIRQLPARGDEPLLRMVLRSFAFVMAIACAVSALAAALGYLDLADLLGVGLLLALMLSVGLFAIRVAIGDVVTVAMSYGPFARLRTVIAHRAIVERGLRSVLDAGILATWAWLVLGRFQLREPLLDVASTMLGTTLRAGGLELPVGQVLAFVAVLIGVVLVTRVVVVLLEQDVFSRMTLPRGVPYALSTLTRYALLLAGFVAALGALGLDLTHITVLVSALGLGLGFGLQQIMNNFVSGLILLFERPVQVGDSIQMDALSGDVLRIGIRSSTVRTSQGAEVIVPNAKMIEEKVTNWTLSDRRRRCDLDLSVAAEDDVDHVMQTIVEVARRHPKIIASPAPEALLIRLGRNANHYQLRFWTDGVGWIRVWSDVAVELHRSLRSTVRTVHPSTPARPATRA